MAVLAEGTLGIAYVQGPGFFSRLFLVVGASVGQRRVQALSTVFGSVLRSSVHIDTSDFLSGYLPESVLSPSLDL